MKSRHRGAACTVTAIALAGFALVACGSSSVTVSSTPSTSTSTTSTTAAAGTSTTKAGGTSTTKPAGGTSTTKASASTTSTGPTSSAAQDVWATTATVHRGQNGQRFTITCTPGGTARSVWGTETYTDDSSICTAAVHVGLITLSAGGSVEYEIAPGLDSYSGTSAKGITTGSWGKFEGSYIFPAAPPGSGHFAVGPESWTRNAADFRGQNGKRVTVECSANGSAGSAWGTGTYTDDSSVCTAAVHAGLITVEKGGKVVIEIAPGQDSYKGSSANGITTSDYGRWDGSFTFPKDQTTG